MKQIMIVVLVVVICYLYRIGVTYSVALMISSLYFLYKLGAIQYVNYILAAAQISQKQYQTTYSNIFTLSNDIYHLYKKSIIFIRETELLLNGMRLGTPSQIIDKFERMSEMERGKGQSTLSNQDTQEQDNAMTTPYKSLKTQFQFSCVNLRTQIVEFLINAINQYIQFLNLMIFIQPNASAEIKCALFKLQTKQKSIKIDNLQNLWHSYCDIIEFTKNTFDSGVGNHFLFILVQKMKRIEQSRKQFELSFTINLKREKKLLFADEDNQEENTQVTNNIGLKIFEKSSLDQKEVSNNNSTPQNKLQFLKQQFASGVKKYKLLIQSILENQKDKAIKCHNGMRVITPNCYEQGNQMQQTSMKGDQKETENSSNIKSIEDNNDKEWMKQLKEQLDTQLDNLVTLHNQIKIQIDVNSGDILKKRNSDDDRLSNDNLMISTADGIINDSNLNQQNQNSDKVNKDLISIFEANTFVEDTSSNDLDNYFGKKQTNQRNMDQVSFIGEMKEVLSEKQKKPTPQQKIVLDTEEEIIKYEKRKFNMKGVMEERKLFQQTNQFSLLSELKFVMKK